MKTINISNEDAKELKLATLTETKTCTCLSWNRDASKLALIVDKRQIYFWDIKSNNFTHFRPNIIASNSNNQLGKLKSKEIDLISWSRVSDKLVVCYSSGQILLCSLNASDISERFIDNGEGVLKRITFTESSSDLDLFVCVTCIAEILVMTFDGMVKFYMQCYNTNIIKAKFSCSSDDTHQRPSILEGQQDLWLGYQSKNERLYFKRIVEDEHEFSSNDSNADIQYHESGLVNSSLVDFHWLSSRHLITCHTSGCIFLLELGKTLLRTDTSNFTLTSEKILDLSGDVQQDLEYPNEVFKSFVLTCYDQDIHDNRSRRNQKFRSYSLAAISNFKLFYYELFEADQNKGASYSIEKVDDLDLTSSLHKLGLNLSRADWSFDCSMLAVQLSNGHILIYRTRLSNYMVSSCRSKTAYMSAENEITILDYDEESSNDAEHYSKSPVEDESSQTNNNASTISVGLRASVIAVGPKHLAVALNNRVRYFLIKPNQKAELSSNNSLIDEQEYASIVIDLSLCSKFVAVHFEDGRLKLHAIQYTMANNRNSQRSQVGYNLMNSNTDADERFFPDPTRLEHISAFTLTEELFIYCTIELSLNVFSLTDWSIVQVYNHSGLLNRAIIKLRPNEEGNKYVCLSEQETNHNVVLYELYTNRMLTFSESKLYQKIFDSQLVLQLTDLPKLIMPDVVKYKLNQVIDAIWDTDGRTVLLIERRRIHNFVILNHTLEREDTSIIYVASVDKASSYTTLYASHGIVSFQTSLGRVINSISKSHDDELKLMKLKSDLQSCKDKLVAGDNSLRAQAEAMKLKLVYLRTILSIYPLSKCKEICDHLMSSEQFNFEQRCALMDEVLWKQLAAWALYTMNLNFALLIYRKHMLLVSAHVLSRIISDARIKNFDSKVSIKTRLMILLGCDVDEDE